MPDQPAGATIPGVTHHTADVNGTTLHYVSAGSAGSPILLVHGFPETWWVFHELIPLLAATHRVYAVDLRGCGDSAAATGEEDGATFAEDLHELVTALGVGPVHLSGQDIAGNTVFRLAATHPEDVRSLTAVETGLSGFGLEGFADVAHGGAWHFGAIATPGVAEFVFTGRMRDYLSRMWFPVMVEVDGAVDDRDIDEFTRTFERPGGWNGPHGLYAAALHDGDQIKERAAKGLTVPVLAVDGEEPGSTGATLAAATSAPVRTEILGGVGHHVALEAPDRLAEVLLGFVDGVDG